MASSSSAAAASSATESNECAVCYEVYNSGNRSKVPCEYEGACNFNACKKCIRVFLLSTTNDPCCMLCNKAWSDKFLVRHLNVSFVRVEYRTHRKELLTQQQISRLPATMAAAESYKQVKALEGTIKELWVQYHVANKETRTLDKVHRQALFAHRQALSTVDLAQTNALKKKTEQEWRAARDVDNEIERNIRKLEQDIRIIKNGGDVAGMEAVNAREVRAFIMPCSNSDCRGFLSTQYKCGICDQYTCAKCFEFVGANSPREEGCGHACKPENVESADLIRKQTKPCPCCGTRISKIDGCDQMWCTQCFKAFSWNTGKIVTGVIHNPHFYQYQREHGGGVAPPRNPGDVLCGGLPTLDEVRRVIRDKVHPAADVVKAIMDIHRLQNHLTETYINTLRRRINLDQDFEEERVLYIVNEITREQLATRVMRKDIARKKNTALIYVCELFTTVAMDMFRTIMTSVETGVSFILEVNKLCLEYDTLRQYCNDQFKEVSITYGVCVPSISAEWVFSTSKFNAKGDTDKYIERREENKKKRDAVDAQLREESMATATVHRLEYVRAALARRQPQPQLVL